MIPVFFAYSGFQTASFIDGELRDARFALPKALVAGVIAVVVLYVGVVVADLRVLGPLGLAATPTPVPDSMRIACGALASGIGVPGHPFTTVFFIAASLAVVITTAIAFPRDTFAGFGLLLSAVPVYFILQRLER